MSGDKDCPPENQDELGESNKRCALIENLDNRLQQKIQILKEAEDERETIIEDLENIVQNIEVREQYKKTPNPTEELEKELAQKMNIIQSRQNENNAQAAEMKELTRRVNLYEQGSVDNDRAKEVDFEQKFKHLRTQRNLSNFADEYVKMVKQNTSLRDKCGELETEIRDERKKIRDERKKSRNLAEFNGNLCNQIEELKKGLQRSKGDENDSRNAIQVEPHELDGFVNPCNCPVSCGYAVGFFIFHKMESQACNVRLIVEVAGRDCRNSLQYFLQAGIIEEKEVFSAEITDSYTVNDALKDAVDKIKKQSRPAFLLIEYEKHGHCVALMPYGACIDVSERRYWVPEEGKRVVQITVVNFGDNALKDWEKKYGPQKCEDETFVSQL